MGSDGERIALNRLREIIDECKASGLDSITATDLLARLGIEDDELDLLKFLRKVARAGGNEPRPGRRHTSI